MKPKQITLDYQEFLDMQSELDSLKKPAEGTELSEAEHQEATGILLVRALQNPQLIRQSVDPINLGKYIATIITINAAMQNTVKVKFERT